MDDVYGVEVEATADSVADARKLAQAKLGIPEERIVFTVVSEGKRGFLGRIREPAVITARAKPPEKQRRRRRTKPNSGGGRTTQRDSGERAPQQRSSSRSSGQRGNGSKRTGSQRSRNQQRSRQPKEKAAMEAERDQARSSTAETRETPEPAGIEEQASVAAEFLQGLLDAFGLEGEIVTETTDDILVVRVNGDQTEALVGNRGVIMQSVLELTRTVVQRKTFGAPRMRIDIAGYGERRREALRIYAGKLADTILADGGEVMLEPMNPADRKVVHDTIADIEGVRSFSEGEEPERSVVIAAAG